jgi:hypothetical protein
MKISEQNQKLTNELKKWNKRDKILQNETVEREGR